jgi:predicted nucleic acid-binding protein
LSTYADTSFLVSLYLTDTHTAEAERHMASGQVVWLTPFHVAEWTHAVEQHVFRRVLSRSEADHYHERFQRHRETGLWVEAAMPESVFDVCAQLARRHGAKMGLRTLDTLHVASALELKAERFWTFDDRQKKLARAVGLKTEELRHCKEELSRP